jgi:hypothetical protein
MERESALDELLRTDGIGVASFGYIGFADREFLLRVIEEHCKEPIAWFTYKTFDDKEISSIYTIGDPQKVEEVVNLFADVIHELNRRAVFSKCFSGNPDLPIHMM